MPNSKKKVILITKFHELFALTTWMSANLSVGMDKHDMHDALVKSDRLGTDILKEHAFKDDLSVSPVFKTGAELMDELSHIPEHLTIGSLSLIADAALRNLDQRIHDDFDLYLCDEKVTSRITAVIKFQHFGDQVYFDLSPSETEARKKAFQKHIQELGLKVSMRESRYKKNETTPALSYEQNRAFFDRYFSNLGAKITYTLDDGYIDEIALSMPLDKMAIYQKTEAKPDAKPFSQTLTEPEAYTVKKNLKDLLGLLQINCANADMTFRPIVKPEVILSLLRSYLYNIEQVMAPELPLCQAMEQKLNPIRNENQKARDMQNQKGDRLLKQAQGKIQTLYTDMYETMESFVNRLNMSLLNLYFGQYGAVFIQITQACPGLNRTGPLETVVLKNTREPQIIDSDHNWNCILDYFRQLDTGASIQEAVLNRDRNIRSYTIGLRDFQAIHRLNGDVK